MSRLHERLFPQLSGGRPFAVCLALVEEALGVGGAGDPPELPRQLFLGSAGGVFLVVGGAVNSQDGGVWRTGRYGAGVVVAEAGLALVDEVRVRARRGAHDIVERVSLACRGSGPKPADGGEEAFRLTEAGPGVGLRGGLGQLLLVGDAIVGVDAEEVLQLLVEVAVAAGVGGLLEGGHIVWSRGGLALVVSMLDSLSVLALALVSFSFSFSVSFLVRLVVDG